MLDKIKREFRPASLVWAMCDISVQEIQVEYVYRFLIIVKDIVPNVCLGLKFSEVHRVNHFMYGLHDQLTICYVNRNFVSDFETRKMINLL